MCKQVPVLRVVGFVFLVLAILAVILGFFAPFWIRLPYTDLDTIASSSSPSASTDQPQIQNDQAGADGAEAAAAAAPSTTPSLVVGHHGGGMLPDDAGGAGQAVITTTIAASVGNGETTGSEFSLPTGQGMLKTITDALLANGTYLGLWAACHQNLSCRCFAENEFEMELAFSDVHKSVQGIYSLGLLVLLIGLLIGSFHVCCCHCCRDSYAIATVVGSFIASGLILIFVSLAIFAGFYAYTRQVEITGDRVFEWAFYVPIGGIGSALIAAILFLVDGRRGPIDSDGDGEETAKMV